MTNLNPNPVRAAVFATWLLAALFLFSTVVRAQDDLKALEPNTEDVEALYDSNESASRPSPAQDSEALSVPQRDIRELSDLSKLTPFDDIAVISRKYLPKSGRVELSAAGLATVNNAFFQNWGAWLRGAYHFSERWGLEGSYIFLTDNERDITRNLKKEVNVEARSLVNPTSYYGVALRWSPIYGKMARMNQTISPFDMYFSLNGGMTQTAENRSEPTLGLGTGQTYARSQSIAFRWDVLFSYYPAQVRIRETDGTYTKETLSHYDVFLSAGFSLFLPEVRRGR